MIIFAVFSEPQQQAAGVTSTAVTLHTAHSGRACGEFLIVRHLDGRTEYRAADDAVIAPDAPFDDVATTVRCNHFQRTYVTLRDQFHGEVA